MTNDFEVKVICSCIPGLEEIVIQECNEKLNVKAHSEIRGRVSISIDIQDVCDLVNLRSVHHYWVVAAYIEDFFKEFRGLESNDSLFYALNKLPTQIDWTKSLEVWKKFKCLHSNATTSKDFCDTQPTCCGDLLSFRATATRTGKHSFGSMDVAKHFGGGVNDYLRWQVNLTDYDLEIVIYVLDDSIAVGVQLTDGSQGVRNTTHFGPTTLKAVISYCLLRLADSKTGDIICDPMCGGGSISIEGACALPDVFQVAGDNHEMAVHNAHGNWSDADEKRQTALPMSILRWDIYHLPLRDACVDHIVTDLPFGKKIGNKERNLFLYPVALNEMARVCLPGGAAILLTQHKQAMWKAINRVTWWNVQKIRRINMGGLNVCVYVLNRTMDKYIRKENIDK